MVSATDRLPNGLFRGLSLVTAGTWHLCSLGTQRLVSEISTFLTAGP